MVDAGGQQPLTYPYCEGDTLHCSATAICTGTCCGAVVAQCFDDAGACLGQAYCCNDSHCPAGQLCNIPQLGQAVPPGRCE
jgi:hypothetical protein